ncbi:T9SS-dependent choice-of-anchor J family protein [Flavobacterium orientale]|nr:choice-of-anchor J domain-containing protein [Flavobacterium orientale]
MKKLYIFTLLFFSSFNMFSQFYEGFEGDTFPPPGWLVADSGAEGVAQPYSWTRIEIPNIGNWAAYMDRYNIGMGNTSLDWLITPQISVTSNQKLFFSSRTTLAGNQGTLFQVRVSTNPNQSELSSYTVLQQYTEHEINSTFNIYQENAIDLQAFVGQTIHIAFVRVFTQPTEPFGGDRWLLDDIYITHQSMYNPNNSLMLNAFLDLNNNGIKDNNEKDFYLGKFSYQFNSQPLVEGIGTTGYHKLYHPSSFTYNIGFQINPAYSNFYSCNTTYSGTISGTSPNPIFYFPVTISQELLDVEVSLYSSSRARPGYTFSNFFTFKNNGNTTIPSGTITFTNDPTISISQISQTGTTPITNGFIYEFTDLQPMEKRTISVQMPIPQIPIINLGDQIVNTVSITPSNDYYPLNNTSTLTRTIVGSYDPNDKMENHGPTINIDEFGPNDYLYYTIRFENTGTAAADFVKITDLLHTSLNPQTFEMIDASHTYNATRIGNQLEWFFEDIDLPPTSQNPDLSQGFVHFKIKPNPGFAVGDIIPNTAEIYFDYNPAIITNTFETEFISVLSVTDNEPFSVAIYPNPSNQFVYIKLDRTTDALKSIAVFDVLGKQIVSKESLYTFESTLDIGHLNAGTYFVEITTQSNLKTTKKLVIK